jgi:hypothetical protein
MKLKFTFSFQEFIDSVISLFVVIMNSPVPFVTLSEILMCRTSARRFKCDVMALSFASAI